MKTNLVSFTAFAALVVLAVAEPSSNPRGTLDTSLWGSSKSRNSWAKSNISKSLSNPSSAKRPSLKLYVAADVHLGTSVGVQYPRRNLDGSL
ncbi:uncharacterized protein C8R40DRAFT_1170179 [Lentinula edodes]|uniref:uncharacterized protein n=1 Tax=Lentinula edodes TaxID=5353 RepID=UPI001E8D5120|nr:uncharacterized protein C8R40DRAFT_1170179 [Lentinula edodes]KAH7875586.1 hypothetical protein C8R40DRAFT_1170179 [Lentinula edodes]